ncbi:MAG: DNA polymerase III subunit gamma/tau, partial [Nitrospiraceae bacterium]|nr:DNA polymerase III subunit gamma/tau [Nitrospiraceae bacterium]
MKYIALYRKYRPQVFEDVVEQGTVVKILQEALKQKKVAHAYLFAGPKGTGKTSIARIFAKGLNCESGPTPTPCMKCSQCITITNGTNLDVIEIDAASNRGIDEIRDLKEKVQYAPVSARYKVYIIDEAHMLTMQAFNALLKTLEEPPDNVVFILATTEPEKIPSTIISRCERFYFKPISIKGLVKKIKEVAENENAKLTDSAAMLIARFATGSLRNALSLLDQAITMFDEIAEENIRTLLGIPPDEVLKDFLDSIIKKEPKKALSIVRDMEESGKDSKIFINEFLTYLQDLLGGKIMGFSEIAFDRDPAFVKSLREQAKYIGTKKVVDISEEFARITNIIRFFPDPFFPIQLAALKCMEVKSVPEATQEENKTISQEKAKEQIQLEEAETLKPAQKEEVYLTGTEKEAEISNEKKTIQQLEGLDLVKAQWGNILNEVKKEDRPLHAILER